MVVRIFVNNKNKITRMERLGRTFPTGFPKSNAQATPIATESKVITNAFLYFPNQSNKIEMNDAVMNSIKLGR